MLELVGNVFALSQDRLATKDKKQVYKTEEGVIITFEGDKAAVGLTTESIGNNRKRIIIETGNLIIK